ncbi:winged helix-turn-helix domain-containing protein [Methanolobus sp. ZRKC3]|uniref:winged helix-turn-helix domain-containing protein n=1 Tax=Methanolobus sp. ZRKC3 TaxID=3125786 RepID=UPI003247D05D
MKMEAGRPHLQSNEISGEEQLYSGELAEIKAEIASLNRVVTRVVENSNRQQMNMMVSDIRDDISRPMLNYMLNDTRENLDCMNAECEMNGACRPAFESILQQMLLHLLDDNVDENVLMGYQQSFNDLKACAPKDECEKCVVNATRVFDKQMELLRTFSNIKDSRKETGKCASISTLSEDVVNSICEPLANKQRLLIMKSLVNETRSFSELSKLTGLRGGNLLFHLQKLLDTAMILQRNERGDYMITSKGQTTLQGLADLYSEIEKR